MPVYLNITYFWEVCILETNMYIDLQAMYYHHKSISNL